MKTSRLLVAVISFSLLSGFALAKTGHFTLRFNQVLAFNKDGSHDTQSRDQQICQARFSSELTTPLFIQYRINLKTLKESAVAKYKNNLINLYPEGISSGYYFMTDKLSNPSDFERMVVILGHHFKNHQAGVLYSLKNFNCAMVTNHFPS